MAVSTIGIAGSHRCQTQAKLVGEEMRKTLKKFMLLPRSCPNEIIDSMTNYSTAFINELINHWENLSETRTGMKTNLNELEFSETPC